MHSYPTFTIEACGLSDIGLVRPNNEDVWGEIEELGFFVLADGMGGHKAGEIASREAVSFLLEEVKKNFKPSISDSESENILAHSIRQANKTVFKMSRQEPGWHGMGTTLSCLMIQGDKAILGNVGDSRIYRLRNNKLELLTRDDSLFRDLVDLGQLSEQNSAEFVYKNIITKAVGTEAKLEPTMKTVDVQLNDVFLLATDGLTDLIQLNEFETMINATPYVEDICLKLIETAKMRGGYDNMTALVIRIK